MKPKILFIIVIGLFIISAFSNIYLLLNRIEAKDKIIQQIGSVNSSISLNADTGISENNPIDKFFDENKLVDPNTFTIRRAEFLYMEAWKAEMEHAYDMLLDKGHKDIKDSINESKNRYLEYAGLEGDLSAGIYNSDAFGDELGNYSETIHYGTSAQFTINETLARLYKNRTLEIFK